MQARGSFPALVSFKPRAQRRASLDHGSDFLYLRVVALAPVVSEHSLRILWRVGLQVHAREVYGSAVAAERGVGVDVGLHEVLGDGLREPGR
jgi:hypothetical protein